MAEKDKKGFVIEFSFDDIELLNELADLDGRSRKKYVENVVIRHLKKIKNVKNGNINI